MTETLLFKQYGLHLISEEKSNVGAGSDTWFLNCQEGRLVSNADVGVSREGISRCNTVIFARILDQFCNSTWHYLYLTNHSDTSAPSCA